MPFFWGSEGWRGREQNLSTLLASPLAPCNYTNMVQACLALLTVRVWACSPSSHLYGFNFRILVSEPRGVCGSRTFKQAPLSFQDVYLESEAANILVYVFLYLSLHQSNLVTQKSPPHGSSGVLVRSGGLGTDGKECTSSTRSDSAPVSHSNATAYFRKLGLKVYALDHTTASLLKS